MTIPKHAVKKTSPLSSLPVRGPPKSTAIPGPRYYSLLASYPVRRIVKYNISKAPPPALPARDVVYRPRINTSGRPCWLHRPANVRESYPKRFCYTHPPRPALYLENLVDLKWGKWLGVYANPSKIPRTWDYNPLCANGYYKPAPSPIAYQRWQCNEAYRGAPIITRLYSLGSVAFWQVFVNEFRRFLGRRDKRTLRMIGINGRESPGAQDSRVSVVEALSLLTGILSSCCVSGSEIEDMEDEWMFGIGGWMVDWHGKWPSWASMGEK
ncbi:hypothetical protein RUND412_007041 [Rhizina undulata]